MTNAIAVEITDMMLRVVLDDGRELSVPIEWFPRLRDARGATLQLAVRWPGRGHSLPDIDEDISVAGLLRGRIAKRPKRAA